MSSPFSVLFTGYAPVHFVCFRPLYDRLTALDGVDVFVSGGLRSKTEQGFEYDLGGMYTRFGINPSQMLTVEQISERDFDVQFAANTKMISPRHAGARVQIFHGVSFRNRAVRPENTDADHYFIAGPYMRRAFAHSDIMPDGDPRALPIGFMKTDALRNGSVRREEVLDAHGLTGDRPVVLYAPTGQKHNSLETMGEKVIKRIGKSGEFDLIIKTHDHPRNRVDWSELLSPLTGEHVVLSREDDVSHLLCAADLLMTDASSVSSEYSLLDRPMVFLDVPKLINKAQAQEGAMVDLMTWGRRCGSVVESPGDVLEAIEQGLTHPQRQSTIRCAMAKDLFYNPGSATDAAFEWLAGLIPGMNAARGGAAVGEEMTR